MRLYDVENNEGDYNTKRGVFKLLAKLRLIKPSEVPPSWEEYKGKKGGSV